MALQFKTKMKTDLLNSWGASKKIYVAVYAEVSSNSFAKRGEGNFTLSATPAVGNKITYSTPINMAIGDDSTVKVIGLFDSAPASSYDISNLPTDMLAMETLSSAETFQYGGTFRINSIEIELT